MKSSVLNTDHVVAVLFSWHLMCASIIHHKLIVCFVTQLLKVFHPAVGGWVHGLSAMKQ